MISLKNKIKVPVLIIITKISKIGVKNVYKRIVNYVKEQGSMIVFYAMMIRLLFLVNAFPIL